MSSISPTPSVIPPDVLRAINSEMAHQAMRHGNHRHTPAEWLLILEKLMHDARYAWVTGNGDEQAMHEIRQIATTAIQAMMQCGAYERRPLGRPAKLPGDP